MVGIVASLDVAVGTQLWLSWADIALEQLGQATAARTAMPAELAAGRTPDLNTELHPVMVTVTATAASLDGFATVVEPHIPKQSPTGDEQERLTELIRALTRSNWPRQ